jgi:hypothetical protein
LLKKLDMSINGITVLKNAKSEHENKHRRIKQEKLSNAFRQLAL